MNAMNYEGHENIYAGYVSGKGSFFSFFLFFVSERTQDSGQFNRDMEHPPFQLAPALS